jgi:hypothetical protein
MFDIVELTQTTEYVLRYGFLGVGLLLLIGIAPILWKATHMKWAAMASAFIGILLISLFAATDFIQRIFPDWLPAQIVLVGGELQKRNIEFVTLIRSDLDHERHAYIRREFDPFDQNLRKIRFFFLTRKENLPKCLVLELQPLATMRPEQGFDILGDEPIVFNVPLETAKLRQNSHMLVIRLEPIGGALSADFQYGQNRGGSAGPLTQLGAQERDCTRARSEAQTTRQGWLGIRAAHAQPSFVTTTEDRLLSADPLIRRDARIDLSRQGPAAFEQLGSLLGSDQYRLQLGAAAAIAAMPRAERDLLTPELRRQLEVLTRDPDTTLSTTARRALGQ